jgi:hypothetical protein
VLLVIAKEIKSISSSPSIIIAHFLVSTEISKTFSPNIFAKSAGQVRGYERTSA